MKGFKQWILPLVLILAGAAASATAVTTGGNGLAPGDRLLVLACSVLLSGCIVLLPALRPGLMPSVKGSLLAAAAFLLLAAAGLPAVPPLPLLRVAAGIGILLFMLASISDLLYRIAGSRPAAAWWVMLAAVLLTSITAWAGPLLETLAAGRPVIDAIIASSPLSYLAALAEWDYLRGEWFYRHAPFGGFRYDYPSAVTISLICLGTGLAVQLASCLLAPGRSLTGRFRHPPTPSQP